ncbi:NDMA-dependent alcohol dehydrogenase [Rhodococcus sp. Eu-32]|uniref:NDMA-dependent alcohol dehydrogenase n=1 Tax=Rhodococcus sp. Eu-32 TaxID=1017319 RepID=UPI000DF212B5|nr:NDMA-dependent alcohol dehydrogenase [Rhodococcus sp. Eu-32]RRQ29275.1 NDMA-dependent alcohol dehydrogenase [Rhodococcus sp. Eu-32]
MKTKGALLWEPGTNSGWQIDDIEIDPPKDGEVVVRLAASGMCHSDQHLDTGDIPLDWAPILGGHEGAGVIEEVGPNVDGLAVGDHVVLQFLPTCGSCWFCVRGQTNLCDMTANVLSGFAPDGTHRVHSKGHGVGCYSYLGTFSEYVVAHQRSVIKIGKDIPLDVAALAGCGVPTGYGSAVYAAETEIGDTCVVIGCGGVGSNAIQGFRIAGAENIIAVDPVPFKQDSAKKFGATLTSPSIEEAYDLVYNETHGRMADRVVVTMGVGDAQKLEAMMSLVRKGGTLVFTNVVTMNQIDAKIALYMFSMSGKRLQGTLYGSCNPRNDIPKLMNLYRRGELLLDELITTRYKLDDINTGWKDLEDGKIIRGLIDYSL